MAVSVLPHAEINDQPDAAAEVEAVAATLATQLGTFTTIEITGNAALLGTARGPELLDLHDLAHHIVADLRRTR